MGTNQTKSKMRYNRNAYRRYEFNVRLDSKLNELIERYKKAPDNNLSDVIKTCLCNHFGISRDEADGIFVPYHFDRHTGEQIRNDELDKYITEDAAARWRAGSVL